jgi:hypothetical protein
MDERTQNMIAECKRQEESCLYTSGALFEWVKWLRKLKTIFVVAPIIFGAVATMPLLRDTHGYEWLTAVCALLAGVFPAVYKALDLDISLEMVGKAAHQFKILQNRFRHAAEIVALGPFELLETRFGELMEQMDAARAASPIHPERFFLKARQKIERGHYRFEADGARREAS